MQLRGFVSRRLSFVGVQLQEFWHKTLTSGHSLKQAFSPRSLQRSSDFPAITPYDAPSQETFLPVFSIQASRGSELALEDRVKLPQGCQLVQAAPAVDPSLYRITSPRATSLAVRDGETQTIMSTDSSPHPQDAFSPYANAYTQTEPSIPAAERSPTLVGDSDSDHEKDKTCDKRREHSPEGDGDNSHVSMDTELSNEDERPEIYDGRSQVVVTDFNGKKHLAILVTQGMIESLEVVAEYNAKLQRLAEKLKAAKDKVDFTNIDVRYIQGCIDEAKSPEEADNLREELAECQLTLPADTKRRDELQDYADVYNIHVKCDAEACVDTLQTILTDAGLLKTHFERDQWEPVDEDDHKEEDGEHQPDTQVRAESQLGMLLFDGHSDCTDYSRVSVDELYRRAIKDEVRQRYNEYYEAEHEFDIRHEQYQHTKLRWRQLVDDGECSMTQTEFDHCDFEATRNLGNEMFAAEQAYEEALARRNRLGLGDDDQESGFFMDMGDGYPLSYEDEGIASAPRLFIEDWLEEIPKVENLPNMADLSTTGGHEFGQEEPEEEQDWEIQSAQMSDTWSCRDLTRNRKRIDRWNEITGREK
ncbi:MAG: hypothetical protein LQ344_000075 [Seirophora lacunosa]|nr:MAG: hypothetical protein LQ344_000075 [Seirophora lacunosa]